MRFSVDLSSVRLNICIDDQAIFRSRFRYGLLDSVLIFQIKNRYLLYWHNEIQERDPVLETCTCSMSSTAFQFHIVQFEKNWLHQKIFLKRGRNMYARPVTLKLDLPF